MLGLDFTAYGATSSYECGHRENRREAREKRLGLIRAVAREEEVNATGLYSVDCAVGSYESLHKIHLRPLP
jgi:hypothetical protein